MLGFLHIYEAFKSNYVQPRRGADWIARKFEGAEHSERAWRERVHIPLRFLLETH